MNGDGNAPAFRPHRAGGGHLESYFVKLNAPDGGRALWLKWTLYAAPGAPPRAECWAVAFERGAAPRAAKRSVPYAPGMVTHAPFGLAFGAAEYDGRRARGELTAGDRCIAWDLALAPRVPSLRPFPFGWMYRAPVPETKLVTPVPDALAAGTYTVDGVVIDVTGWRGMQGHNWGTRHTHRYAWCHAAGFDGAPDVVFEGFSAQLAKAGVELPWLTLAFLWVDGAWVRFDHLRAAADAHTRVAVMRWSFDARAGAHRLRARAEALPGETAGLQYPNPRGAVTYCLNSKLAALTLEVDGPAGPRVLTTTRAALELGWPSADHGVAMLA